MNLHERLRVLGQRVYFDLTYRLGGHAKKWHSEKPSPLLVKELERDGGLPRGGRALDVGCGGGTNSAFLARKGFDLTCVDLSPKALGLTRRVLEAEGLRARVVKADVVNDLPPGPFDLIFDRGIYHGFGPSTRVRYAEVLKNALAPGGVLLLGCFEEGYKKPTPEGVPPFTVSPREISENFEGSCVVETLGPEFPDREMRLAFYRIEKVRGGR